MGFYYWDIRNLSYVVRRGFGGLMLLCVIIGYIKRIKFYFLLYLGLNCSYIYFNVKIVILFKEIVFVFLKFINKDEILGFLVI